MIIRHALLRPGRSSLHRTATHATRRWLSIDATPFASRQDDYTPFANAEPSVGETATESVQSVEAPSQRKKTALEIAEEYEEHQRQNALFQGLGGSKPPSYSPHQLVNDPPRPSDITLELLLASQAHMGAATSRWNPANAQYIFGIRDNTHIISLDATAAHLRRAAKVVTAVASRGGLILFVGTRAGQERAVVKAAELAGGYHLFERWVPGSLTNSTQILGRCRLKVVDEFDKEVKSMGGKVAGLPPMRPDLVVVMNPMENGPLLGECAMLNVPTVGVVDTDANPLWVTYPIPANDDSLRCIAVIAGVLGRAGEEGRKYRLEQAKRGRILAKSTVDLKARRY